MSNLNRELQISIIGDYDADFRPHAATDAAIGHAAENLGVSSNVTWIPTASLETDVEERLRTYDALWCAPGSPYESMDGALRAIRFARRREWPFLGTCGGFQHVVIEYARNVLGFDEAQHAEYDPYGSDLFISKLKCSPVGKTMTVYVEPESKAYDLYKKPEVQEEYYCDFGLNPDHQTNIDKGGLRVVGVDQDDEARILELPDHRFFLATLFVPQLTSTPDNPHPMILAYLQEASKITATKAAGESRAT